MMRSQIKEAADFLRANGFITAHTGIVLGTGLAGLVGEIDVIIEIPYDAIPHFVTSTVETHTGRLIYGNIGHRKVIAMQGRFHFYEGYTMDEITFPVRVMQKLGIRYMLLSNAAGAINLHMKKGELMLVADHINLFPANPLTCENDNSAGTRFHDMSEAYSLALRKELQRCAQRLNIKLNDGTYAGVTGPSLETPAEYRFLKRIGADAVGMSTIPEVIACNHGGLPCAVVSVLTDECDPDNLLPVDIADIIATAGKAEPSLTLLFKTVIAEYNGA